MVLAIYSRHCELKSEEYRTVAEAIRVLQEGNKACELYPIAVLDGDEVLLPKPGVMSQDHRLRAIRKVTGLTTFAVKGTFPNFPEDN